MRPLFYCYVCVLMLLYSYYICSPYIYLCPHIYIYMRYTYIHIYTSVCGLKLCEARVLASLTELKAAIY